MNDSVAQKVREIVAEQAQRDMSEVTLESTPEDLGLDSLKIVDIIFHLEEAFDVVIPFNANAPGDSDFQMTNIGDVVRSMEKLTNEAR